MSGVAYLTISGQSTGRWCQCFYGTHVLHQELIGLRPTNDWKTEQTTLCGTTVGFKISLFRPPDPVYLYAYHPFKLIFECSGSPLESALFPIETSQGIAPSSYITYHKFQTSFGCCPGQSSVAIITFNSDVISKIDLGLGQIYNNVNGQAKMPIKCYLISSGTVV